MHSRAPAHALLSPAAPQVPTRGLTHPPTHPPASLPAAVTYTRFALCTKCYSAECAGHGKGLPPGMQIGELLPARNPRIPATVDTIQEMENEFFDTRTVRRGATAATGPLRPTAQPPNDPQPPAAKHQPHTHALSKRPPAAGPPRIQAGCCRRASPACRVHVASPRLPVPAGIPQPVPGQPLPV